MGYAPSRAARPAHPQPSRALLAELRARIGLDRMSKAVSAAAPCPMTVHEHYRALGIDFRQVPPILLFAPDKRRPGANRLNSRIALCRSR